MLPTSGPPTVTQPNGRKRPQRLCRTSRLGSVAASRSARSKACLPIRATRRASPARRQGSSRRRLRLIDTSSTATHQGADGGRCYGSSSIWPTVRANISGLARVAGEGFRRRSTHSPSWPPARFQRSSDHLRRLESDGQAVFREARSLWQLTPEGKEAHAAALADDVAAAPIDHLKKTYPSFLELNDAFKLLCGDWQLRDGQPNDHSDARTTERLSVACAISTTRPAPYARRSATRCTDFRPTAAGSRPPPNGSRTVSATLFTGVMCGSYHDVWMELHEDLILTLRIDRASKGVF